MNIGRSNVLKNRQSALYRQNTIKNTSGLEKRPNNIRQRVRNS